MSVISISSGKMLHHADISHLVDWLYEKAIPWIATALIVTAGLPYMKQAVTYLLWKLYEFFIEKNILRL